ncbi:MAG: DUF3052 family protein [Anaerolineales bacterium]|jgi:hypothetical protein
MTSVRLIHWNDKEAAEKAKLLQNADYEVIHRPINPAEIRYMRETPPEAVIIDLSRIPSQGRDMGINLRINKSTRKIPLVFIGGKAEKVEKVRELLPDATFTTWEQVLNDLPEAISNPPSNPVVPESSMAGYSGAPLAKKLGIKAKSVVTLIRGPEGFELTLGELPHGTLLQRDVFDESDILLWFVRSQAELQNDINKMSKLAGGGGLWIIWPKKASGVVSDLTQKVVRETGLANGLVDFKICSVDKTWSGLRFTKRRGR